MSSPDFSPIEHAYEEIPAEGSFRLVARNENGLVEFCREIEADGSEHVLINYPGRHPRIGMSLALRGRLSEEGALTMYEGVFRHSIGNGGRRPATERDIEYALGVVSDVVASGSYRIEPLRGAQAA